MEKEKIMLTIYPYNALYLLKNKGKILEENKKAREELKIDFNVEDLIDFLKLNDGEIKVRNIESRLDSLKDKLKWLPVEFQYPEKTQGWVLTKWVEKKLVEEDNNSNN